MKDANYKDIGLQLRAVREALKMTLDEIRQPVGISAGYISDFERGFKLPTVKYLKYLHDDLNISLDYIFCSSGKMFRSKESENQAPDFGKYREAVDDMLKLMADVPHALFSMMVLFDEYKTENEDYINKILAKKEAKKEAKKT
jgi:transcriptional regulator with XRE-family HTH domain